jgi:5-methylcytosine-specific restriction protein B
MEQIIDTAVVQKLLPKLHGSRRKLEEILKKLIRLCLTENADFETVIADGYSVPLKEEDSNKTVKYPISLEKLLRM